MSELSEIQAILFDLDGVLVDSRTAIPRSINFALECHGFAPRPEESLYSFIGCPLRRVFSEILESEAANSDLAEACVESYRERYRTACLDETTLMPDIEATLRRLTENYRLAVVTSKPEVFARPILEKLEIDDCFDEIVGPSTDPRQQEEKTLTLKRAMAVLDIPVRPFGAAAAAAIVGDRHFDIHAGRELGVVTVGVSWGIGSIDELQDAGADHLVHSPNELAQLFTL